MSERLLPTPRAHADRASRKSMVENRQWSAPSLGQAVEIAQGILPREFNSWDEVPGRSASISSARRKPDAVFAKGDTLTDALWKVAGVPEWAKVNDAARLLPTPRATDTGTPGRRASEGFRPPLSQALKSISSPGVSPAPTSPTPDAAQGSTVTTPASGTRWLGSSAGRFLASFWSRMSRGCLHPFAHLEDGRWMENGSLLSRSFSQTWPKQGMTRGGQAFELPTLVLPTVGSGCSSSPLLPTPAAQEPGFTEARTPLTKDGETPTHGAQRWYDEETGRLMQKGLQQVVQLLPTPTTDDASNTTRASGDFLSLARTAHNLSRGAPTGPPSDDGKTSPGPHPHPPTTGDD